MSLRIHERFIDFTTSVRLIFSSLLEVKIRNPVFIVFKHPEADIEVPYHGTVGNCQEQTGLRWREHVLHIFLCIGGPQGCVLSTPHFGILSTSRIKQYLTGTSVHAGQRAGAYES